MGGGGGDCGDGRREVTKRERGYEGITGLPELPFTGPKAKVKADTSYLYSLRVWPDVNEIAMPDDCSSHAAQLARVRDEFEFCVALGCTIFKEFI
ncbi:hypothetical protein EVAR_20480_1 [Eumeta japonica]|uniref:Uncharacterized protein n=1 Tax=Eumeta variegata TaxID=151549 RepID=A0A4C1Y576_EUMVA|nr:hypothetical protein EVAR_20480_1 [Eumeta japonica]